MYRAISFPLLCPANSDSLGLSGLPNSSDELRDTARLLLSFPFLLCSLETLPKGYLFPFLMEHCSVLLDVQENSYFTCVMLVLVQGFGFR